MTYEACYNVGGCIYSVNMIEGDESKCRAYAEAHAKRFGYKLDSMCPIPDWQKAENLAKGMPLEKIS